jgi:CMP-N,N'-diacetyllegionaminic acid synthase
MHRLDDHHPARIKKIVEDRIVDFCVPEKLESRRQDLMPFAYIRSGSIYALRRDHLMLQGQRYGSAESRPYVLPPERAVNIDSEIDFLIAEQLLKNREK